MNAAVRPGSSVYSRLRLMEGLGQTGMDKSEQEA